METSLSKRYKVDQKFLQTNFLRHHVGYPNTHQWVHRLRQGQKPVKFRYGINDMHPVSLKLEKLREERQR